MPREDKNRKRKVNGDMVLMRRLQNRGIVILTQGHYLKMTALLFLTEKHKFNIALSL